MDGGMQFRMRDRCGGSIGGAVGGIGAVSPLRRFAPARRSGEPRAWWVSMDGGKAKGAVGIDGWGDRFRFVEQTEGMVAAKAPLCKGSSAEGGEGLMRDKVVIHMGTNANSYNFQFLCSTNHLPWQIEKEWRLCSGRF